MPSLQDSDEVVLLSLGLRPRLQVCRRYATKDEKLFWFSLLPRGEGLGLRGLDLCQQLPDNFIRNRIPGWCEENIGAVFLHESRVNMLINQRSAFA